MALTITEKILLAHTNKKGIAPGEFIDARVDLALANDITAPLAIAKFKAARAAKVFDRGKVVLVCDHFVPSKDAQSAEQSQSLEDFARTYKIKHFYPLGKGGIEHVLLPQLGLVLPGGLIVGADSHTCTYGALGAFSTGMGSTDLAAAWITGKVWLRVPESIKFVYHGKLKQWVGGKDLILHTIGDIGVSGALYKAMEFTGPTIRSLSMDHRFTMSNMAIEAGGKSGIIAHDQKTHAFLRQVAGISLTKANELKFSSLQSDKDAKYSQVREYEVSKLEPQVGCPHLPSKVKPVSKLKKVAIDQAVIGSCTNGRISDLALAAKILKNRRANSRVRLLIFPGSQQIYRQAVKMRLVEIFVKAGATVCPPTCGPCLGGHMGVLGDGEVAIATTNRNFRGRMGALSSKVYLSNPAVAAASAIKGRITHPAEI
ncbi:MAG: 3-isopropylmalate dehydratase large subunit [Candidatus Omnitrophica bacterium]|nr:3-isopropylmalate dehydratase large subunit [Candidatus Omnitrophota bacterium]